MKTHPNHLLRGGLKMMKTKSSKPKNITPHPTTPPLTKEEKEQLALEDAERVYRESVMHLATTSSDDFDCKSSVQ